MQKGFQAAAAPGMALCPVQLQGHPVEPMDDGRRLGVQWPSGPWTLGSLHSTIAAGGFLPRQTHCAQRGRGFAEPEPRSGINIAKPPEVPRAPSETLPCRAVATACFTLRAAGLLPALAPSRARGCTAAAHRAELGPRCEMQSRPPEL